VRRRAELRHLDRFNDEDYRDELPVSLGIKTSPPKTKRRGHIGLAWWIPRSIRSQHVARPFRLISIGFSSTLHGTAEYVPEHFRHGAAASLVGLRMAAPPVDNFDNNGSDRSDSRKANRRPQDMDVLCNWGMRSGRAGSDHHQAMPDQVGMARL
jgi:hypothetical protein